MAEKRMFTKSVIDSDAFLEMPQEAQLLYFHLAMRADDDGFITPKKVMRLIGARDDALKILMAKNFIIPFESGVVVIKHWWLHNYIRKDTYTETIFKDEKKQLELENKRYELSTSTNRGLPVDESSTQIREDKIREDKIREDKIREDKENKTKENPENLNPKSKKLTKSEERKEFITSLLEENYVWSVDLETAISDWLEMRDKIKKPATDRAIELSLADALRLAKQCGCTPDEIFNQSTKNSWQGLFPLKQDGINHAGMSDDELEREWNGDRFKVGVWEADKARG